MQRSTSVSCAPLSVFSYDVSLKASSRCSAMRVAANCCQSLRISVYLRRLTCEAKCEAIARGMRSTRAISMGSFRSRPLGTTAILLIALSLCGQQSRMTAAEVEPVPVSGWRVERATALNHSANLSCGSSVAVCSLRTAWCGAPRISWPSSSAGNSHQEDPQKRLIHFSSGACNFGAGLDIHPFTVAQTEGVSQGNPHAG